MNSNYQITNQKDIIMIYVCILLILSLSPLAKITVFFSIPLFLVVFQKTLLKYNAIYKKINSLTYILIIGLFMGLFKFMDKGNLYYFLRDTIYFIQAPIYILLGFYLGLKHFRYKILMKLIILIQFFMVLKGISDFLLNPYLLLNLNIQQTYALGLKFSGSVLSFAIVYYSKIYKINLFSKFILTFLFWFFLFGILISLSRTSYVLVLITFLIPKLIKFKFTNKVFFISILSILFLLFGGRFINSSKSRDYYDVSFKNKIVNSLDEILIKNYYTAAEINNNFRGYEANLGLTKYFEGNFFEVLLGHGFGTVVKTPFWIFQGEKLEIIPMFHNGYITILLKTGLLGLSIFFIFLYKLLNVGLLKYNDKQDNNQTFFGVFIILIIFMVLFRTLVIHGIFTTTVDVALLIFLGANLNWLKFKYLKNL